MTTRGIAVSVLGWKDKWFQYFFSMLSTPLVSGTKKRKKHLQKKAFFIFGQITLTPFEIKPNYTCTTSFLKNYTNILY